MATIEMTALRIAMLGAGAMGSLFGGLLAECGHDVTLVDVNAAHVDAIVVTVPAYQWLWSGHDTFLHHYRRYDRAALERCARAAGCTIVRSSYFNTLLFPLAVVARTIDRLLHRARSSGDALGPRAVNAALYRIFRTERGWLPKHSLPFGVSLFAVLTKCSEPR